MRRDAHGGFGERHGETDQEQSRHRAPCRLDGGLEKTLSARGARWRPHPRVRQASPVTVPLFTHGVQKVTRPSAPFGLDFAVVDLGA